MTDMPVADRMGAVRGLSPGGFHRVSYRDWGPQDSDRLVVCVHGLTRNAGDFDLLAHALAQDGYRVVCPDVVGRGASGRLADPAGYALPQYLADMAVLLARFEAERVDWVGTSMGGLIGMALAAQSGHPLRSLLLNDVGAFIPKAALETIASYVGQDPVFPDMAAAEAYFREVHAPFGALSDAQWRHLTGQSVRAAEGGYRLVYDPAIAAPFKDMALEDADLWAAWDAVQCPVRVLRGADSGLLLQETAAEMATRGPGCEVTEIAGCGHAPSLMQEDQINLVKAWLARD